MALTPGREKAAAQVGLGATGRCTEGRRSSPEPGIQWLGWASLGTGVRPSTSGRRKRMRNRFPQTWSVVAQVLPESGKRRAGEK